MIFLMRRRKSNFCNLNLNVAIGFLLIILLFGYNIKQCACDEWEYKLVRDLLKNYDSSIRPSLHHNSTLNVTFGLSLAQIIDVDERNMIITTNCWLNQGWIDYKLRWDPNKYDGIEFIRIPAEKLWKPDILLVNNADSWAKITSISTNAIVKFNGNVTWLSTVIFKSSCTINVKYFPFDEQSCDMIFASWTFDGFNLDINVNTNDGDATNYIKNGEWNLVRLSAIKNLKIYSCCEEPYPEIYYKLVIRRRPLYYVFNMIFPCLLISLVAFLGFFLPPDSSEKVSIGITTLLSLTVFLTLVAELMPPTSEQLPLLGIYYMTTISIVSFSTAMAVVTLNINNKGSKGRRVPKSVRFFYFKILAKILGTELSHTKIKKDKQQKIEAINAAGSKTISRTDNKWKTNETVLLKTVKNGKNDMYNKVKYTSSVLNADMKKAPRTETLDMELLDIAIKQKLPTPYPPPSQLSTTRRLKNQLNIFNGKGNKIESNEVSLSSSDTRQVESIALISNNKSELFARKASEEDSCLTFSNVLDEYANNDNENDDISRTSANRLLRQAKPISASKFNILTETFSRGSFNSIPTVQNQTPATSPHHLHCMCDCSDFSLNQTTNDNRSAQGSSLSNSQNNNGSSLRAKKIFTTNTNESNCNNNNNNNNNNTSNTLVINDISNNNRNNEQAEQEIEIEVDYFDSSPVSKLKNKNKSSNYVKNNTCKISFSPVKDIFWNTNQQSSNKIDHKNNEYLNNKKNLDVEFLSKLEKILEKQFDPLVKILMQTLKKNDERLLEEEKYQEIQSEWSDVALISDHFLCYFFPFMTFLTCILIFFESPHVLTSW